MEILLPDAVWTQGQRREGVAVAIDEGRIAWVRPLEGRETATRLPGKLLIPGFVNAHSHAFQRAIRGRAELLQKGRESDDFWAWREVMYRAALELSPEDLEIVSRMAFLEMALAGITSVGEFHYLHHPKSGRYEDPNELAHRVHGAAVEVGLDLTLLRVGYGRAGFGQELNPRQVRFLDRDADETLSAVSRLAEEGMKVGLAPHSVRALPVDWIQEMAAYAKTHGLPLHMHVSEQPREIEESLAEHGMRPVQLLDELGILDERFTGVHAIHLVDEEVRALGEAKANVCACPTTERNLGDGIVPAKALFDCGVSISFGTDSQIEIAPLQDARSLEYHLRLDRLQRAVLMPAAGEATEEALAARLLDAATVGGARSLGTGAGRIVEGAPADLVAIDLSDPSIAGADPSTWIPNVVFSMERTAIREVWVGGTQIVSEGRHADQERIVADFERVMRALW